MKNKIKYYHYLIVSFILAVVSLVMWYVMICQQTSKSYEAYERYISEKVNEELLVSEKELDIIQVRLPESGNNFLLLQQLKLKYPVYIFQNGNLTYWSEYRFVPKYNLLKGNEKVKYIRAAIGKFLVNKRDIGSGWEMYSCIPLSYEYSIDNNYISSGLNEDIFTHPNIEISNIHTQENYAVYSSDKKYLFSLDFLSGKSIVSDSLLYSIVVSSVLSIFFLLVSLYYFVNNLIIKRQIALGGLILLGSLVFIRGILLYIRYPYSLVEFDLFNSKYFASSEISPSLGDLFINIIFLSFFSWFVLNNYCKSRFVKKIIAQRKEYGFVYCFILSIVSPVILYYLEYIFSELYSNSQFPLDITQNININSFKIICILIFILVSGIYFIYNHIALRLYLLLIGDNKSVKSFFPLVLGFLLVALVLFIFEGEVSWVLMLVNFIYCSILLYYYLPGNLGTLKYSTYLYFLLTAFLCSFTASVNLYYVNAQKNIVEKHKYAFQLLNENDLFTEYLLNESMIAIGKDKFIRNRLKSIFSSKDLIEQKIKKIILPDYLEKYEVHVSIFDYDGNVAVQNAEYTNYYQALAEFGREIYSTEYPNIYFLNERKNSPLKRYMAFKEIYDNGIFIGGIIVELVHKKNSPNSVYPELLVDKKFITPQQYKNYQYAIYDNKLLVSKGNFNYEKYFNKTVLENKKIFDEGIVINGMHHLGIKSLDGKVVIVSSEVYSFKNVLSNFSFIFFLHLVFVLIFIAGYIYYFQSRSLHLNYATKILVYLNVAFFLPLVIVSIVTLSLISNYYKTSQNKSFIKKAESLSTNILNHLERYQDDPNWEFKLENDIAELADFTDSDINLYNKEGSLLYSYHPAIYDRNLLSRQLNPDAFISIIGGMNEVMLSESLGKLKYNSVYMSVKSYKTGELLGILSIPFFESRQELNLQLIGIFTTILNIFSIIFIVFAGLSYFASRILTSPLNIITQKIKKTTFGENQPLDWNSKDEIGLLISEYNSMLLKLEQNRTALSRSEKESAWREMAKQVAHEIKNPLTPMKLKIQHLQRSWKEKSENVELQTEKGLQSLLDQVNILSEIASSFSAFAKMPIPKTEHFDLSEVLKSTVNLYNNTHDVHVDSKVADGMFIIEGDEQLMGAIFTNLIINAIQSVPNERKPKVELFLSKIENMVVVEIKDNGVGILDSIKNNVFLPNFSTKEMGSGIGLAVAKRGVEHAGGRIWFETKAEEGTSFFMEIPLVN